MPAKRVTTVTLPVDPRSAVAFEAYRDHTPLLTIMAARPGLLVTLTLPEHLEAGHVRFARDLARQAARYAIEVERTWRGLPALASLTRTRHPASGSWPRPVIPAPAGASHLFHSRAALRKEPPS